MNTAAVCQQTANPSFPAGQLQRRRCHQELDGTLTFLTLTVWCSPMLDAEGTIHVPLAGLKRTPAHLPPSEARSSALDVASGVGSLGRLLATMLVPSSGRCTRHIVLPDARAV